MDPNCDPSRVERIEIYANWTGMATPPSSSAKLVIHCNKGGFEAEEALKGVRQGIPQGSIREFLEALASESVTELNPSMFRASRGTVERHFSSLWTDDYPGIAIRLFRTAMPVASIRSDSQHAGMLPLRIKLTPGEESRVNWNPRLSAAIHALLPESFLGRRRFDPNWLLDLETAREEVDRANEEGAGSGLEGLQDDQTPLMRATWSRDWSRFRLLVKGGADVEARQKDGMAGLHQACASGELDAVREWILAGANVNARTTEGHTPLMFASRWPEIIRLLLEHRADINSKDNEGKSALVHAILDQSDVYETEQAVRLLLKGGADPRAHDREGRDALAAAKYVRSRVHLDREVRSVLLSEDPPLSSNERQAVQETIEKSNVLIQKTLGRRLVDDLDLAESVVAILTEQIQGEA